MGEQRTERDLMPYDVLWTYQGLRVGVNGIARRANLDLRGPVVTGPLCGQRRPRRARGCPLWCSWPRAWRATAASMSRRASLWLAMETPCVGGYPDVGLRGSLAPVPWPHSFSAGRAGGGWKL